MPGSTLSPSPGPLIWPLYSPQRVESMCLESRKLGERRRGVRKLSKVSFWRLNRVSHSHVNICYPPPPPKHRLLKKETPRWQSPNFQTFKEPRNRFHGIDSARLLRQAESIPWNQFLGSLKDKKFGLRYEQYSTSRQLLPQSSKQ